MFHALPSETALHACFRAIGDKLVALDSNFNNRVHAHFHPYGDEPDSNVYPYVVMVVINASDANIVKRKDALVTIQVSIFDIDPVQIESDMVLIDNALDGKGTQESDSSARLDGGTWNITSVTAGTHIAVPEFHANSKNIYHNAREYTITMEID